MPKVHTPRQIAPRLSSGLSRDHYAGGLPPDIKAGLRAIAAAENQSVSWVLEQAITDYFGLMFRKLKIDTPEYVERKAVANGKKTSHK